MQIVNYATSNQEKVNNNKKKYKFASQRNLEKLMLSMDHDPSSLNSYSFCYLYSAWLNLPERDVACNMRQRVSYARCLRCRTCRGPFPGSFGG
jgi:hypothetical protein